MGEKGVPNRRYPDEFRGEAARLANSVGHKEAARRLGGPMATLGNWARKQREGGAATPSRGSVCEPRQGRYIGAGGGSQPAS